MRVGRFGLSAVVLVTAGLFTTAHPVAASGGGGPTAQDILGSGSDTTQFMMSDLDKLYLFSPGCAQIPTPSGPTAWLDFSCQASDPPGTVTTENYEHDQVHQAYFLGSSNGIKQMCNQGTAGVANISYARSSRVVAGPGQGGSDCTGLHAVAYARDAISWEAFKATGSGINTMHNTSAPCPGTSAVPYCLTQAQLQGIYDTCTITNWSQVGGANVPISIYTPQPGSGTRKQWELFLSNGTVSSDHCIPAAQLSTHVIPENSNTGIPTTDRKGAIFPFSFGVWTTQVKGAGGAVYGAIDGVKATPVTLANNTFPYGRYLYNVYCASCTSGVQSSTQTVKYVGEEGWICKPATGHGINPVTGHNYQTDIANAIKANGFVPLPSGLIGGGDPNSDFCRLNVTS